MTQLKASHNSMTHCNNPTFFMYISNFFTHAYELVPDELDGLNNFASLDQIISKNLYRVVIKVTLFELT